MAIKRITISVPEAVAKKIKKAAGTRPVSAWITEVVEERLDDAELERRWLEFYEEVAPSSHDVREAEALLARLQRRKRPRRGAA
ncbi:MAG: hypothetical protein JST00_42560 [Deltaproteobacteria bacterium]|nr:hypothetical protein [Deltaproteobacteria bacterium]